MECRKLEKKSKSSLNTLPTFASQCWNREEEMEKWRMDFWREMELRVGGLDVR